MARFPSSACRFASPSLAAVARFESRPPTSRLLLVFPTCGFALAPGRSPPGTTGSGPETLSVLRTPVCRSGSAPPASLGTCSCQFEDTSPFSTPYEENLMVSASLFAEKYCLTDQFLSVGSQALRMSESLMCVIAKKEWDGLSMPAIHTTHYIYLTDSVAGCILIQYFVC